MRWYWWARSGTQEMMMAVIWLQPWGGWLMQVASRFLTTGGRVYEIAGRSAGIVHITSRPSGAACAMERMHGQATNP